MDRFRKILVSVDAAHSDAAPQSLVRASKLAQDTGAELRVVDVTQQLPALVRKLFHGDTAANDLLAAEHQNTTVWVEYGQSVLDALFSPDL